MALIPKRGPPRDPHGPRALLARHGLHPKKSWGQNFLVDRNVHERIARAAEAGPDDVVVEIGAGLGTLTMALLAPGREAGAPGGGGAGGRGPRQVIAIERDPDMLAVLRAELATEPRVDIRAEDAAHFDFRAEARAAGRPLIVVGNLPYQITTVLLFAIIEAGEAIERAVLMVQREFAERVLAAPGSKIYGRLSVMVQQRAAVRALFKVSPAAFFPRPTVMSAVLSLTPRSEPLAPVRDQALFERVVKEAFSTRRKMLRRSLGEVFGDGPIGQAFQSSGVVGTRRPEELSIAELARLSEALAQSLGPGGAPATDLASRVATRGQGAEE